jgi:hypothetical protein
MPKRILSFLVLLFFLSSCAVQKTLFFSEPPGARVSVNGKFVGTTPCEYRYRAGSGRNYLIELEKDNYQSLCQKIETDAVDKASRKKWLVAGLIWSPLWLGTVFTKKLKDSYHFVLSKIRQAEEASTKEENTLQMSSSEKGDGSQATAKMRKSS